MQSLLGSCRPQGYLRVEKPLPLPSPFPDPIPETSFSLTSPASHSTAALHRRSTVQDCSTAPTASATTARPPLRLSAPQQWASPRAPCHPPALGPAGHVEDSRLLSVWDSRSLSPTRLGDIPCAYSPRLFPVPAASETGPQYRSQKVEFGSGLLQHHPHSQQDPEGQQLDGKDGDLVQDDH